MRRLLPILFLSSAACAVAPASPALDGLSAVDTGAFDLDEPRPATLAAVPVPVPSTMRCDGTWKVDLRSPGPVIAGGMLNIIQTGVVDPTHNGWDEEHDLDAINAFRVTAELSPTTSWRDVARNQRTLFSCDHEGSLTFVVRLYDHRGELATCRIWGEGSDSVFAGRHSRRHTIHRASELTRQHCSEGPLEGLVAQPPPLPIRTPGASPRERMPRPATMPEPVDTAGFLFDTGAPE